VVNKSKFESAVSLFNDTAYCVIVLTNYSDTLRDRVITTILILCTVLELGLRGNYTKVNLNQQYLYLMIMIMIMIYNDIQ
jgi:hypothetical protein